MPSPTSSASLRTTTTFPTTGRARMAEPTPTPTPTPTGAPALADARLLVTGGAGFIGSNFVRLALARWPRARVHVLDALTYAGNRRNLEDVTDPSRLSFQHGDISDRRAVAQAIEGVRHVVVVAAAVLV